MVSSLTISTEEIQETERLTRGQSKNNFWFEKRKTVLRASNFENVAKTKVEPSNKLKAILYGNFTTEAVQYGLESEQKAVDLFVREMSKDGITVEVEDRGNIHCFFSFSCCRLITASQKWWHVHCNTSRYNSGNVKPMITHNIITCL